MAIYEVTAPDGRQLEIEGDTPPTEQDLDKIFADLPVQDNSPQLPEIQINEDGSIRQPLQGGVKKNINLTPSGISSVIGKNIVAGLGAPFSAIKNKTSLPASFNQIKNKLDEYDAELEKIPSYKVAQGLEDAAAYSYLPIFNKFKGFKGAGIANQAITGAYQGGLIGGLDSLKDKGNLSSIGSGAAIGGGIGTILPTIGVVGKKFIENPKFQSGLSKTIEALTSVPQKYTKRALDTELAGNSLFKGKFDKEAAYRPVERKLKEAINRLPSKEYYAEQYSQLAKKAKTGIDKKLLSKNQELNNIIKNMPESASDISTLRSGIDESLDKFRFGDVNPALEEAGGVINRAKSQLGYKNSDEIAEALQNYANKYKSDIGLSGLDKEGEEIAFNVLAQATKKNKNWLKSQLKAELPKMSTEKRQEFIENLLEYADDKIENLDPTWVEKFPELNWYNLQETSGGGETVAKKMFDRIMGKNFSKSNINPQEQMFIEADTDYAKILDNFIKNPNESGYSQAVNDLERITQNFDDYSKNLYYERLMNDFDNIDNIINPKIKPATIHGVKEQLYDRANFSGENFGNYGNSGIKSMANELNQYLRNLNPDYAKVNDELKLLNSVKFDIGGPQGINQNTLSAKLRNIGSESNTLNNMDERLKNLNTLLDNEYKFFNDAKQIADTQKVQDEMLKLIGANQKLRNPRLLENITDEGRLNALKELQRNSGINFMNDLENIRAREALENWFPGQGGGSGSQQGFGNLLRSSILGGVPTAAVITHNPASLLGLGLISPKLTGQGTIKNLGAIYKALGKEIPSQLFPTLYSAGVNLQE